MVWVSPAYGDTQTQGVVMGGHLRIVRDGLGISSVRGYSDTGGGGGWTSEDCPGQSEYLRCTEMGQSEYLRCTEILRHKGW